MTLTRRRAMAVVAVSAIGASVLRTETQVVERFRALGAEATLTVIGDKQSAETALRACRAEIAAVERVFSLWNADSELARLNEAGRIAAPDPRFIELATHARAISAATGGAFDPTVQVLWQALAKGEDPAGKRPLVGWRGLSVKRTGIAFDRPGMAATFNGIAQGYAADRVAWVLATHGFRASLVDLGEFRAVGPHPARPWRIGIRDPNDGGLATTLEIDREAVATSEPAGTRIAKHPHIFDPLSREGEGWRSVTVLAPQAWRADALSTAIAASPQGDARRLLRRGGAKRAVLIGSDGVVRNWRSDTVT